VIVKPSEDTIRAATGGCFVQGASPSTPPPPTVFRCSPATASFVSCNARERHRRCVLHLLPKRANEVRGALLRARHPPPQYRDGRHMTPRRSSSPTRARKAHHCRLTQWSLLRTPAEACAADRDRYVDESSARRYSVRSLRRALAEAPNAGTRSPTNEMPTLKSRTPKHLASSRRSFAATETKSPKAPSSSPADRRTGAACCYLPTQCSTSLHRPGWRQSSTRTFGPRLARKIVMAAKIQGVEEDVQRDQGRGRYGLWRVGVDRDLERWTRPRRCAMRRASPTCNETHSSPRGTL